MFEYFSVDIRDGYPAQTFSAMLVKLCANVLHNLAHAGRNQTFLVNIAAAPRRADKLHIYCFCNPLQRECFGIGGEDIAAVIAALCINDARLFQPGHDLAYQHGICAYVLRKLLAAEHLLHMIEIDERVHRDTERTVHKNAPFVERKNVL